MSRVYQKPPTSTTRRTPATQPRPPPPSTSTARGARAPIRGQTMRTQLPRDDNVDNKTDQQERTVHVGFVSLVI